MRRGAGSGTRRWYRQRAADRFSGSAGPWRGFQPGGWPMPLLRPQARRFQENRPIGVFTLLCDVRAALAFASEKAARRHAAYRKGLLATQPERRAAGGTVGWPSAEIEQSR